MNTRILSLIAILILCIGISGISLAHAASPSPSPTTAPSTQPQTATDSAMKNIKERVEMVKQTTDPQVKGMITALKQPKFGIIGTLDKIVGSTLQIKTARGTLRLVELDHNAVILRGQRPVARGDIELNAPVIAMGFRQTEDDSLLVRRLILADESLFGTKRTSVFGKVDALTTKLLTLKTFYGKTAVTLPLKIAAKTTYFNTLNDAIKRTDIKVGDPVIAILPEGDVASVSAQRFYSLSPKAIPTPTVPVATP